MTSQTFDKDQLRDAWDAIASGFDEYITPVAIEQGERALRRVSIRPGTRFLDVGAGSGALCIPAARRGADVVGTDIAPAMIDRLAARARAEGLAGIEGRVLDVRALDLPTGTFDIAASQNGVTMVPELEAGLAEMARVTKPGGTVLVVAFGDLAKVEFIRFFLGAVKAVDPGFPGLPGPLPPFRLADPDVFRGKLADAGLSDAAVDTVTWDMPVESADHLWNQIVYSNPIGTRLARGLTDEQRRDALQVLDGVLRERSGGGPGAVLHAEVNIGTARKPTV